MAINGHMARRREIKKNVFWDTLFNNFPVSGSWNRHDSLKILAPMPCFIIHLWLVHSCWLKADPTWLSDIQYGLGWSSADREERGLKTGLLAAATLPPYPAFNLERLPGIFVWERQLDRWLHVIKCRQTLLPVLSTVKTTLTSWAASLRGWGRPCQCYSSAASCRKVHCLNLFQGRLLNIGGKFPPSKTSHLWFGSRIVRTMF